LKKGRPKLIKAMLRVKRKVENFITLLLQTGLYGFVNGQRFCIQKEDMNLTTKTVILLSRFGLTLTTGKDETVITSNTFPDMFPAWIWLAAEAALTTPTTVKKGFPPVPPVRFSHCLYSDTYPYARDVLLRLADDSKGLPALVDYLEKGGIQRQTHPLPLVSQSFWIHLAKTG
jgi:hypothetical protein